MSAHAANSEHRTDDPTDRRDRSGDPQTLASVTAGVLEIEEALELFSWTVDGVPFWERLRFDVHKTVLEETGVLDAPQDSEPSVSSLRRLRDLVEGLTVRNPLLAGTVDVAILGHPRRKQLGDGRWWNVRCDPVARRLDSDWVLLESPTGHGHRRPARTERLRYLDAVELPAKLRGQLGPTPQFSSADRALLARIRERIRDRFGVDVDVRERANHARLLRDTHLPWYTAVLDRLDPELVALTVSYGYARETQIEACRRLGVPVVELQHGVIDPYHLGYSFPGSVRDKWAFPDYLFVYGPFWRDVVEYPLPEKRIYPLGYPFLERETRNCRERSPRDQFLFVSQGAIGRQLSKFAARLASRPAFEPEIVYKLHPAETDRYPEAYPWLARADLRVSDGSSESLYDLFAASSAQVGVYSTALYEGLGFGLQTYVVDLPGAVKLDPLVQDDTATVVGSVEELVDRPEDREPPERDSRYFADGALERVPRTLDALVRAGTQCDRRHARS